MEVFLFVYFYNICCTVLHKTSSLISMWGITSPGTLVLARARRLYASRQLKESPYIYQLRSYRTEIIQRQDSPKEAIFFFFFTRSAFLHRCCVQIDQTSNTQQRFGFILFFSFFYLPVQWCSSRKAPAAITRDGHKITAGKSNLIVSPRLQKSESDAVFWLGWPSQNRDYRGRAVTCALHPSREALKGKELDTAWNP